MPDEITVTENFKSRFSTTGSNPNGELRYDIIGTNDDAEARAALRDFAPLTFDVYGDGTAVLYQLDMEMEPVGDNHWTGVVHYGLNSFQPTYEFDTTGATAHITLAREHIGDYAPSGQTAPNHSGLINVTKSGAEGVDITVPGFRFQETYYFTDAEITGSYKVLLAQLTGCVNNAVFRGFSPGECLFKGSVGRKRGLDLWEITFIFECSPNAEDLQVADGLIEVPEKFGWDYLWVESEDDLDDAAKRKVKKPISAHLERVYRYADLNEIGI